ncbi:MAG: LptF/LptG family permease, partial [Planktomarina sp.]
MARIDLYILKQLLALFGFFALVLVLIYWINRAVALFDQLIADGQSAFVFLEFTALTLPTIIALITPMAAFAAVLYVINRLSSESELTVMQAAGFSALRLSRPIWVFAIIVFSLMLLLNHILVPSSQSR